MKQQPFTRRMKSSVTTRKSIPNTNYPHKKIAIIGAGAAGLAMARVFSRQAQEETSSSGSTVIVLFEQSNDTGGVWNYQKANPVTNPSKLSRHHHHHPMYRHLRTNLPKEIMAFREFPFPQHPGGSSASFLTHAQIQDYLKSYRDHFELNQYIVYNAQVQHLQVLDQTGDCKSSLSPEKEDWSQIRMEWTNTQTMQTESDVFDAVCICNGHYNLPSVPQDLLGTITNQNDKNAKTSQAKLSYFTGKVMHSVEYDEPSDFANQRVLCIGGRASGADIAREIAPYAQHVYLSDSSLRKREHVREKGNVSWVPTTVGFRPDGSVQFEDCNHLRPQVDTVIFCTGYEYHFPFINDESNLELEAASRRVKPLLHQLWHAIHPNVLFAGLPHSVVPFPLFELQAEAAWAQWQDWSLPLRPQRIKLAEADAKSGGEGKVCGRIQDTHYLGDAQWDYNRKLAKLAGIYNAEIENYLMTSKVSGTLYRL